MKKNKINVVLSLTNSGSKSTTKDKLLLSFQKYRMQRQKKLELHGPSKS